MHLYAETEEINGNDRSNKTVYVYKMSDSRGVSVPAVEF